MDKLSLYIHVPFCLSKCKYCDFASFSGKESLIPIYFSLLKEEIKRKSHLVRNRKIDTVYIGGGTPSFVKPKFIAETLDVINKYYNLKKNAEISIETNPKTIDEEKIRIYKESGINRISIGLQSSDDYILKFIGRIHAYEDFLKSYDIIRSGGIDNINIDLMFSLPFQTLDIFKDTLYKVTALKPEHISVYSLIVEENTPIKKEIEENNIIIDEETDRAMYHFATEFLADNGYSRYEISNFAKKGYECRHNLLCWDFEEYLGFGSSAHSYFDNKRFANPALIEGYINMIKNNKSADIIETLNKKDKEEEYIMLSLRKTDGVNLKRYNEIFNCDFVEKYKDTVKFLVRERLISLSEKNCCLTDKGADLLNSVTVEFFK